MVSFTLTLFWDFCSFSSMDRNSVLNASLKNFRWFIVLYFFPFFLYNESQVLRTRVKVPVLSHSLFKLRLLSLVPAAFATAAAPVNRHWSLGLASSATVALLHHNNISACRFQGYIKWLVKAMVCSYESPHSATEGPLKRLWWLVS